MPLLGSILARAAPHLEGLTSPVVVACSGGPDSVALLAVAVAAGLEPVAVHVDHGARPGSATEADHVAAVAVALGVASHAESVVVAPGPGFEARAREARYQALESARQQLGASAILVGHTRDDQAETVLLNLLRGAATAGLAGMPARRGWLRRPLLGVPHADLLALCAGQRLLTLDDPMNGDLTYRRVWLRREVIPALERGAGRDLRAVLARQAEVLRGDEEVLHELSEDAAATVGDPPEAERLAALRPALARRVVRRWLGPPPADLDHVDAVLEVAVGKRRAVDLPGGVRVARAGGRLTRSLVDFGPGTGRIAPEIEMPLPGSAEGVGLRLEAWVERAAPVRWPEGGWVVVLDADRAGERAVLRSARPGERFQPLGLAGHKAVADGLREAGVPAERRAGHPVLSRPDGETLWVVGYRIDDRVRVDGATRRFLWIVAEEASGGD